MMNADGEFSTEEWQALVAKHQTCPGCARNWGDIAPPENGSGVIHADHKFPMSKGGSNWIWNIQPLCFSCNSAKGAKVGFFWMHEFVEAVQVVDANAHTWVVPDSARGTPGHKDFIALVRRHFGDDATEM